MIQVRKTSHLPYILVSLTCVLSLCPLLALRRHREEVEDRLFRTVSAKLQINIINEINEYIYNSFPTLFIHL